MSSVNAYKTKVIYPGLIGIFFVLHTLSEAYVLFPFTHLLICLGVSFAFSLLVFGLVRLLIQNTYKAGSVTLLSLLIFYFFDNMRYYLGELGIFPTGSTKFILGGVYVLFLMLILRSSGFSARFTYFLNLLFTALIVLELSIMVNTYIHCASTVDTYETRNETSAPIVIRDKPDVYHIVLDAYTSSSSLKKYFGYDNRELDTFLQNRGFHIATNATSTSTATQKSMTACFYMQPMKDIDSLVNSNTVSTTIYRKLILRNPVMTAFQKKGYKIVNLSVFDLLDTKRYHDFAEVPDAGSLPRYLLQDCLLKWPFEKEIQQVSAHSNLKIFDELDSLVQRNTSQPVFVYAHVGMPHPPYFFDRKGKYIPSGNGTHHCPKLDYLDQLIYTNSLIKKFVRSLKAKNRNAVVIIHGDHGSRLLRKERNTKEEYTIYTAIYATHKNGPAFSNDLQPSDFYITLFPK